MTSTEPTVSTGDFRLRRVAAPPSVLAQVVGFEAVLLDLDTEHYFGLDWVGTSMWQALTAADTLGEAYDRLLDEFEVEPEVLETDLVAFVDELVATGLLVETG
jgi:hypothetical protein